MRDTHTHTHTHTQKPPPPNPSLLQPRLQKASSSLHVRPATSPYFPVVTVLRSYTGYLPPPTLHPLYPLFFQGRILLHLPSPPPKKKTTPHFPLAYQEQETPNNVTNITQLFHCAYFFLLVIAFPPIIICMHLLLVPRTSLLPPPHTPPSRFFVLFGLTAEIRHPVRSLLGKSRRVGYRTGDARGARSDRGGGEGRGGDKRTFVPSPLSLSLPS